MGSLVNGGEKTWKLVEQRTDKTRPQTLVLASRTLTLGRTNQASFRPTICGRFEDPRFHHGVERQAGPSGSEEHQRHIRQWKANRFNRA